MDNNQWKTLTSKYVLKNTWFKVRQDAVIKPNGESGTYNVIECGESAFIIPVTEGGMILLIKQHRYPTNHAGWEVPAGGVELGEEPLQAAQRELQEETGMIGKTWKKYGVFDSMNGMTDAVAHVFEATNLVRTDHNEQAEEGISEVKPFSAEEILAMILDGSIVDALSISALTYHLATLKKGVANSV